MVLKMFSHSCLVKKNICCLHLIGGFHLDMVVLELEGDSKAFGQRGLGKLCGSQDLGALSSGSGVLRFWACLPAPIPVPSSLLMLASIVTPFAGSRLFGFSSFVFHLLEVSSSRCIVC